MLTLWEMLKANNHYVWAISWQWSLRWCCYHLVNFWKLTNLVEDGGASSTLQQNSGFNGARNFCGVFRPIQNGTTNVEIYRRVTLCSVANGKSNWSKCRWHGFGLKHWIVTCDSPGEQVLEWPIHKIVLVKEVDVRFHKEEIWCQDGLTFLEEPVVMVSKEERHCF